jgi:hypothetical protein
VYHQGILRGTSQDIEAGNDGYTGCLYIAWSGTCGIPLIGVYSNYSVYRVTGTSLFHSWISGEAT